MVSDSELKTSIILDLMAPYILNKVQNLEPMSLPFKVNDLTDIVYGYSRARRFQHRDIYEILSDKVSNLIMLKEPYGFPDVSKLGWAVSRYYTKSEFPNYNADISSMIKPRAEYIKARAVKHRNLDKIFSKLDQKDNKIEAAYLPMTLYSMSSVGYTNKVFYDTSILSLLPFVHDQLLPEDLGYTMQAMAINNITDYNEFFADALRSVLPLWVKNPSLK